jgi:uncharacterized protein (DUF1800 family)
MANVLPTDRQLTANTATRRAFTCSIVIACSLIGCATPRVSPSQRLTTPNPAVPVIAPPVHLKVDPVQLLNRITWGASRNSSVLISSFGIETYLNYQLNPPTAYALPREVQEQMASMAIRQQSLGTLINQARILKEAIDKNTDPEQQKAAKQQHNKYLNQLLKEAQTRSILLALYSPNQLQEQLTWFWFNHFNVYEKKHDIRAMVGDYEARAIRPFAMGYFRDLLRATLRHPAMLRYLDNDKNAANKINENYARELLELHTLGINGGYTQRDVQELARILTGVGIVHDDTPPKVKPQLLSYYVRDGLFEFQPNRHDFGDKQFLGRVIRGRGMAEIDEVIEMLSRHPSTARFISRKLAMYFVSDDPPNSLVDRLSKVFLETNGHIPSVMSALFSSTEFAQSLGKQFKDPMHYVISSLRLAYDDKPILNATPVIQWLNTLGQPLYGRQTPDGYASVESAWSGPGQLAARFEVAKQIGGGSAGLFKVDGERPYEKPAFPNLANSLYYKELQRTLSQNTQQALNQANSPQEWNTFFLASPEMMRR